MLLFMFRYCAATRRNQRTGGEGRLIFSEAKHSFPWGCLVGEQDSSLVGKPFSRLGLVLQLPASDSITVSNIASIFKGRALNAAGKINQ